MSQFKHTPLSDASKYIRLLSIHSPPSAATAQYHLSTWAFNEAPQYHAISYTWGSADRHELIELDGRQMAVGWNCAYVLHQICHFRAAKYYWIDTLCINQGDLEEKGHQVAMMGNIFQRAQHVLACLGEAEDEDVLGLRILQQYSEQVSGRYADTDHSAEWKLKPHCADWLSNSFSKADIFHFWMTCTRLIRRDYFTRVWTTPEFLLARDLAFYIGEFRIMWRSLNEILYCLAYDGSGTLHFIFARQRSVLFRYDELGDCERDRYRRNDVPVKVQALIDERFRSVSRLRYTVVTQRQTTLCQATALLADQLSIPDVLRVVHLRCCFDPRDSIYAMLPFLAGRHYTSIVPDYGRALLDLAVEVLQLEQTQMKGSLSWLTTHLRWLSDNLQLERHHHEVQNALFERKMQLDRCQNAKWVRQPDLQRSINVLAAATYLGRDYSDWRLCPRPRGQAVRSVLANDTDEVVGVAGAHARTGDCVLWLLSPSDAEKLQPILLIVRRVAGSYYAIVSLVKVSPWSEEDMWRRLPEQAAEGFASFCVYFDPKDYVTYFASRTYNADDVDGESDEFPASELVNAGVCRAPFSSFAERIIQDEPQDSPTLTSDDVSLWKRLRDSASRCRTILGRHPR